jgi:type III secretion system YscQ/HrcQ family protein
MKAQSKRINDPEDQDQAVGDPFAVDMFLPRNVSSDSPSAATAARSKDQSLDSADSGWSRGLPRVTPAQLQASSAIATLSPEFYSYARNAVVTVLSRYTLNKSNDVQVSLLDLSETDFSSEPLPSSSSETIFLTFISEPNGARVSFELETSFAAFLIDHILGGKGHARHALSNLTKAERAVTEFLCLSVASEFNEQLHEPLMRLQSVSEHPPWWNDRKLAAATSGRSGEVWQRGILASLLLTIGDLKGVARVYLGGKTLSLIDEASRRFRIADPSGYGSAETISRLNSYQQVVPDIGMSVLVGTTDLNLQDLLQLERGDVMVIEKPMLFWNEGRVRGQVSVRVGDSDETLIIGRVGQAHQRNAVQAGTLTVKVGSLNLRMASGLAERLPMQEEIENAEAQPEGENVIDDVMLTVRVELAARRLRLEELARLRSNQILDLGCNATDPVDLMVDGRRVARGDLVDIEGRLGVRIKQIMS